MRLNLPGVRGGGPDRRHRAAGAGDVDDCADDDFTAVQAVAVRDAGWVDAARAWVGVVVSVSGASRVHRQDQATSAHAAKWFHQASLRNAGFRFKGMVFTMVEATAAMP